MNITNEKKNTAKEKTVNTKEIREKLKNHFHTLKNLY